MLVPAAESPPASPSRLGLSRCETCPAAADRPRWAGTELKPPEGRPPLRPLGEGRPRLRPPVCALWPRWPSPCEAAAPASGVHARPPTSGRCRTSRWRQRRVRSTWPLGGRASTRPGRWRLRLFETVTRKGLATTWEGTPSTAHGHEQSSALRTATPGACPSRGKPGGAPESRGPRSRQELHQRRLSGLCRSGESGGEESRGRRPGEEET